MALRLTLPNFVAAIASAGAVTAGYTLLGPAGPAGPKGERGAEGPAGIAQPGASARWEPCRRVRDGRP